MNGCCTITGWFTIIGTKKDYIKSYYNNELVFYMNTRPFGIDIYGNKVGE